jgi:hypothetical protein
MGETSRMEGVPRIHCTTVQSVAVKLIRVRRKNQKYFILLQFDPKKRKMNIKWLLAVLLFLLLPCACGKVTFNMSGASVAPAKTCQVNYIENRAEIVNPRLSLLVTEGLKDKIQANTSLNLVNNKADVLFEGEITSYNVQPQAVTAAGVAAKDRLTITVKIKFTNEVKSENSYEKSFSRFYEYSSGTAFTSVENAAVEDILKELMDDIFNEAFSTW